jgi:hypothetical protein
MAGEFLRVANFEEYQHYEASRRQGGMLFIRWDVGTRLLEEFTGRGGTIRLGQWIKLLDWAGATNNRIPAHDAAWVREFGRAGPALRDRWIEERRLVVDASSTRRGGVVDASSTTPGRHIDSPSTTDDSAQPSQNQPNVARNLARTEVEGDLEQDIDVGRQTSTETSKSVMDQEMPASRNNGMFVNDQPFDVQAIFEEIKARGQRLPPQEFSNLPGDRGRSTGLKVDGGRGTRWKVEYIDKAGKRQRTDALDWPDARETAESLYAEGFDVLDLLEETS